MLLAAVIGFRSYSTLWTIIETERHFAVPHFTAPAEPSNGPYWSLANLFRGRLAYVLRIWSSIGMSYCKRYLAFNFYRDGRFARWDCCPGARSCWDLGDCDVCSSLGWKRRAGSTLAGVFTDNLRQPRYCRRWDLESWHCGLVRALWYPRPWFLSCLLPLLQPYLKCS